MKNVNTAKHIVKVEWIVVSIVGDEEKGVETVYGIVSRDRNRPALKKGLTDRCFATVGEAKAAIAAASLS